MFAFVQYVRAVAGQFLTSEEAQDAFEYLLVIGGVSVAVIIAITTPVGQQIIDALVDGVCAAMATIEVEDVPLVDCTGI